MNVAHLWKNKGVAPLQELLYTALCNTVCIPQCGITAQSLIERMSKEMVSRKLERHCCILANLSDVDLVLINAGDKITFHFQIILLIFPTQLRLTVAGLWHVSPLAPLLGCLSAALSSNSSCRLAYPALSLVQNALSLSTQLISLTSHCG